MRTLLVTLFILGLAVAEQSTPTPYQDARRVWADGDRERALALLEPLLETPTEATRETHELYQNIEIYAENEENVQTRYRQWHEEAPSAVTVDLLARVIPDLENQEALLREGLRAFPDDRPLQRRLAISLYRQGRWKDAESAFNKVLGAAPRDFESQMMRFEAMRRQGRVEDAMDQVMALADAAPEDGVLQALAFRCLKERRPDNAREYSDRLEGVEEKETYVWTTLIGRAFADKDYVTANQLNQAFLKVEPEGFGMTYAALHAIVIDQDAVKGLALMRRFTRLHPLEVNGWSRLADVFQMMGRHEEGRSAEERILKWHPNFAAAHHGIALSLLAEEAYQKAIPYLEKALELDPSSLTCRNLAVCYERLGNHAKAKHYLTEAQKLSDSMEERISTVKRDAEGKIRLQDDGERQVTRLVLLGQLQAEEGKLEDARASFRKAAEASPQESIPHRNLALLEQMGFRNPEKAVEHWRMARAVVPDGEVLQQVSMLTNEAYALDELGRTPEAVELLETFLAEHGDELDYRKADLDELLGKWQRRKDEHARKRLPRIRASHCTESDYCLSQSLAIILDYWEHPIDVRAIGDFIGEPKTMKKGLAFLDSLKEPFESAGFTPSSDNVRALLEREIPVLLMGMFPHEDQIYEGHATVAVGYDDGLAHVLIEDANWFRGMDRMAYERLPELRALAIAPPEILAQVPKELFPDRAFHEALTALEGKRDELPLRALLKDAKEIVALAPHLWWGHRLVGVLSTEVGDLYEAEMAFERAAERSPHVAEAELLLSQIYVQDGLYLEAVQWLRRALEKDPNLHPARYNLIRLLFDPEREHTTLISQIEHAMSHSLSGKVRREIVLESERYLKFDADEISAALPLTICQLALNDYKDAEASARRYLARKELPEFRLLLALALKGQGKKEAALEQVEQAAQIASPKPEATPEQLKAYYEHWRKVIRK